jgi:hypothetical protein
LKSAELKPERYVKYMEANPFDELLVDSYNKDIADLNDLRKQTKEIRLNDNMSPKDKQDIIKVLNFQQNIIKRNLIEKYKAYEVEP